MVCIVPVVTSHVPLGAVAGPNRASAVDCALAPSCVFKVMSEATTSTTAWNTIFHAIP